MSNQQNRAEEKYKPGARCQYFASCYLYNSNMLTEEAELRMCGKGQSPVDKNYIPKMPVDPATNITTREMDDYAKEFLDEMICNAFQGIRYETLESEIRDALTRLDLFYGRRRPEGFSGSR